MSNALASLPLMLKHLRLSSIKQHWQPLADKAVAEHWRPEQYLSELCALELASAPLTALCVEHDAFKSGTQLLMCALDFEIRRTCRLEYVDVGRLCWWRERDRRSVVCVRVLECEIKLILEHKEFLQEALIASVFLLLFLLLPFQLLLLSRSRSLDQPSLDQRLQP